MKNLLCGIGREGWRFEHDKEGVYEILRSARPDIDVDHKPLSRMVSPAIATWKRELECHGRIGAALPFLVIEVGGRLVPVLRPRLVRVVLTTS